MNFPPEVGQFITDGAFFIIRVLAKAKQQKNQRVTQNNSLHNKKQRYIAAEIIINGEDNAVFSRIQYAGINIGFCCAICDYRCAGQYPDCDKYAK